MSLYDRLFKPRRYTLPNGAVVEEKRSRAPLVILIVLALGALSVHITGFDFAVLVKKGSKFFDILKAMIPPNTGYLSKIWQPLWDTIKMSFLGSFVGAVLAVPFAVAAASNIVTNRVVVFLVRLFLSLVRTLPTLVCALIATYIFGLGGAWIEHVAVWSVTICETLAVPLLFLMMADRWRDAELRGSRILEMLLNYIVTPALLIYAAILYLYMAKILVTWTLPEGGVAYLVFGFTMTALAVKALGRLLEKRIYDWFFDRFSLVSLPVLALFWIGVVRRTNEYGLTEPRVYLVVCGGLRAVVPFAAYGPLPVGVSCGMGELRRAGLRFLPRAGAYRRAVADAARGAGGGAARTPRRGRTAAADADAAGRYRL